MKDFRYYQPTQIIFGSGAVNRIAEFAKDYGKKGIIVTRPEGSMLAPLVKRVEGLLESAGILVAVFRGVVPNPTVESIDAGIALGRAFGAEFVIGLGGGSAMDSAKAIAVGIAHGGSCWDYTYWANQQPTAKTLPIITIGTTAGTGSQVTAISVLTKTEDKRKSAISSPYIFPRVGLVDPDLTLSVPKHVTASTGFDVFCHAFESYTSVNATPYADMMSVEAIKLVVDALPKLVQDLLNVELRAKLAWADTLAGLCIANAGVTMPHGIGMTIGGHYPNVMHGEALALAYPAYMRFTWDSCIAKFANLYRIMKPQDAEPDDRTAASKSCGAMDDFLKRIGLWLTWEDFGIDEAGAKAIARDTFLLPDHENNTRIPSEEDVLSVLRSARAR